MNVFVNNAKVLIGIDKEDILIEATAITFAYLLAAKTDQTAETYFITLASEAECPELALLCYLLRQAMQGTQLTEDAILDMSSVLAAFKETILTSDN